MAANIFQVTYQNPDASMPMQIPVLVVPNTPEHIVNGYITENSKQNVPWLYAQKAHGRAAIMCGSGPSLKDHIWAIGELRSAGGSVFAINAASAFLAPTIIDTQIIVDAKAETSQLVDPKARKHVFASQVHPTTLAAATHPILFHLDNIGIEDLLPPEKVKRGGYTLIGGGVCGGITGMIVAYALGFREFHFFGYDSCHRDSESHCAPQPMNEFIPGIDVEWGDKTYHASMPMKIQAEAFPRFARALEAEGCTIRVHGNGLLPAMWREPPVNEHQKYKLMWQQREYRTRSLGEEKAELYLSVASPEGVVLDFGCGTGRASRIFEKAGLQPVLVDFADNCRDYSMLHLPFIEHDLTKPLAVRAGHGFCSDVMEHIPSVDVVKVTQNIMEAAETVFFQISTVHDTMGQLIGEDLHLTVQSHEWWKALFVELGYVVLWDESTDNASLLLITRPTP